MFDQLFERSHALVRQRSAPLANERRRYVLHCIEQGMARSTVRLVAELLIGVERCLSRAAAGRSLPDIRIAFAFVIGLLQGRRFWCASCVDRT